MTYVPDRTSIRAMQEYRVELNDRLEQILRDGTSNAAELRTLDETRAEIRELDRDIARLEHREDEAKRQILQEHRGFSDPSSKLTPAERRKGFNAWARCDSSLRPTESGLELAKRAGFMPNERSLYFDLPEARAMGSLDTTYGAKAVPQGFVRSLERAQLSYGSVRSVAQVVQTSGGGVLPFPMTNDTGNKGRRLGENNQAQNTDIAISELKLDAYKYSSDIVLVSVELLQDEEVNLESHIGDMLAERLARIVNEDFTIGTGSNSPNGVVTASVQGGSTTASASAVTYNELVDLMHSVDPAYVANGTWMFNFSTLAALKKIVDGAQRPLWQEASNAGFGGAFPGTILNRPYVINQQMPSIGASTKPILFGDFSKYLCREVKGVELLRLNERYAEYHQVAFLAYLRTDGDLLDAGTHPIKHLLMHS